MIVEHSGAALLEASTASFQDWLTTKDAELCLPSPGHRLVTPGRELTNQAAHDETVSVRRHSLSEDLGTGRWTTTLTAITTPGGGGWLWVDLEWVCDDPWSAAPKVSLPGVVKSLLNNGEGHVGATPMPADAICVNSTGVPELLDIINDRERSIPVVVLSRDHLASTAVNRRRAETLTRELRGIAPVYLLEDGANSDLTAGLGVGMHVVGGAARTYLPGVDDPAAGSRRHRVLGGSRLRANAAQAARLLAEPLRRRALATRPPDAYREHARPLLRQLGAGLDEEALLKDLLAAEQTIEGLRDEAVHLRDEVAWQALADADTERTLEQSQARVRWLESLLGEQGHHIQGEPTPTTDDIDIDGFEDVLEAAASHLRRVALGAVDDGALALDQYPQAEAWARKAWRALTALNEFAQARSDGWQGDFRAWCSSPATSTSAVIPTGWVALRESDSVNANPKYREARTFPVPDSVDQHGNVYMPAHIKLIAGGRPAPRLHFHDDTDLVDGTWEHRKGLRRASGTTPPERSNELNPAPRPPQGSVTETSRHPSHRRAGRRPI